MSKGIDVERQVHEIDVFQVFVNLLERFLGAVSQDLVKVIHLRAFLETWSQSLWLNTGVDIPN